MIERRHDEYWTVGPKAERQKEMGQERKELIALANGVDEPLLGDWQSHSLVD